MINWEALLARCVSFTAPEDHEIQVRNLGAGVFIEDAETNTFSVIFSWQAPSFKHSSAKTYEVSYEFDGGYPRDDLSCSPLQRDNKGCSKTALVRWFINRTDYESKQLKIDVGWYIHCLLNHLLLTGHFRVAVSLVMKARHMWVEFVVGSSPCSVRFFSGYFGFTLSSKTNICKFQFDLESEGHVPPSLNKDYLFIYFLFI